MGSNEEPDRKRKNASCGGMSPSSKKQATSLSGDEKQIDASVLQIQNQKLSQQLEVQREEIHELEAKLTLCREKQSSYDQTLMTVNRAWDQLIEDLGLVAAKCGAEVDVNHGCEAPETLDGNNIGNTSPDSVFLRLLLRDFSTEADKEDCLETKTESLLRARNSQTLEILKTIIQKVENERRRNLQLSVALQGNVPPSDCAEALSTNNGILVEEVKNIREAMDELHHKHRGLAAEIGILRDHRLRDQAEIRRLSDQLEDATMQLEVSRRKIVALRQKENGTISKSQSSPSVKSGAEESTDGKVPRGLKELNSALEASQGLATRRLKELEDKQDQLLEVTRKYKELQASLSDEKYIKASQHYVALVEELASVKGELENCRSMIELQQKEKDLALVREKEMLLRAEAGDAARRACQIVEGKAQDSEARLQQSMQERDLMQRRLEEMHSAAGRKETVAELKIMIATLHKEMNMMQSQLTKYKELAHEVHALRAENQSLRGVIERKARDFDELFLKHSDFVSKSKGLHEEVRILQQSERELALFVEMLERESLDKRDVKEIKRAEARALAQVESLKAQFDEHAMAKRLKAAHEAESFSQLKLAGAEAEIVRLTQQLEELERKSFELREIVQTKNEEGDAFVSEIETIGQAYEEMQSQNRRLLQQITERDDYNTQLMSESVRARQLETSLLAEKASMQSKMQTAAASADLHRQRVMRLEEQAKVSLEQLSKAMEDMRQANSSLETLKRKQTEAEKEAIHCRSSLELMKKQSEERGKRLLDMETELEKERFKRKRVEEERDELKKVARVATSTEKNSAVEQLQEEIKEYKSILKCSVCHDRPKEVVITKCFHLFCNPCIQRNLEIRHRKCPGCGVPFGQNDVRHVYI